MKTGKTIVFVDANVREAVCCGTECCHVADRDGSCGHRIDLPRPRHMTTRSTNALHAGSRKT